MKELKGLFVKFLPFIVVMLLLISGCGTDNDNHEKNGTIPPEVGNPAAINLRVNNGAEFQIDPGGTYFLRNYDINSMIYISMDIVSESWVHTFKAKDEPVSNPAIITLSIKTESGFIDKTYQIFFSWAGLSRIFPNLWTQLPVDETYILSEIKLFPFEWSVNQYKNCDGAVLPIAGNEGLFSLVGNKFGGDGSTTFALPDLSQKSPLEGLSYQICTAGVKPAGQPNPPSGELQYHPSGNYWDDLFLGEIVLVKTLTSDVANTFELCDGKILPIATHQALFALLGTKFGGDGKTTFALPNLTSVESPVAGAKYYIVKSGIFPSRW